MVNLKVTQTIRVNIAVWEFCGAGGNNALFIHDVGIDTMPALDYPVMECLDITGLAIEFKLVTAGDNECTYCNQDVVYSTWGTAYTDSRGYAYIDHKITEADLVAYQVAISSGASVRVLACITGAGGQITRHKCSDIITIIPALPPTHYISLSLGFVPPELVSFFSTYIRDISNQLMTKIAPPPAPWQYQGTTYDAVKNSFNLWFYLPPTATLTMSPGAMDDIGNTISTWGALILGAVLAIIGAVILASAFIVPITAIAMGLAIASLLAGVALLSWRVYDAVTGQVKAETIATNLDNQISQDNKESQAKQIVEAAWEKSSKTSEDCLTRLAAHQSSHNAKIKGYLDIYAKYPDFITKLTAESTTFTTNANAILAGFRTQAYTADVCNTYVVQMDNEINSSNLRMNDLLSTFVPPDVPYSVPCKGWTNQAGCEQAECFWYGGACHAEENCWIPNPVGGCILSAGTGKIIVGTVALVGIIGIAYWVATRHPGEARAIIAGAREEAARARAVMREIMPPRIPAVQRSAG